MAKAKSRNRYGQTILMEFNTFTCTILRPLNIDSSPKPKNGSLKVVVYDASKGEEKRISLSFIYFLFFTFISTKDEQKNYESSFITLGPFKNISLR